MNLTATTDAILTAIIATAAEFDPAATFVGVFTAITDRGPETTILDLVVATGAMAVGQAVTAWSAVYHEPGGQSVCDGDRVTFGPADATEAQTILGWFLSTTNAGGTLKMYGYFAAPVNLPDNNAKLSVIPRLLIDPTGTWDATVAYDGGLV